jgi:hypothetical protein
MSKEGAFARARKPVRRRGTHARARVAIPRFVERR